MITPNPDFKKALSEEKAFVNYADLVLRDGTQIELTPKDFIIGAFSLKDETTSGKFGVGHAIGKTISLTLANHDERFSAYDFYKAIIHMYVAVELEDGRVLKEKKGKYYVMNPTTPGDVIGLSGVDSMYLFDKPYNVPTSYPATLQSIISDCCVACGVRVGFGQFPNYNFIVEQYPEDVTCREVISYAAQLAGMNARINNDDALELVWYDENLIEMLYSNNNIDGGNLFDYNTGSEQDGGNFIDYSSGVALDGGYFTDPVPENLRKVKSLKISTDDVIISGVRVIGEDNTAFLGTDDYVIEVKNNPLVNEKEYQVCEYLYSRLAGLKFRPLTCETTHNPLYEPFDVMIVYDRKGNGYPTLINSVSYKTGGFTTLSCKADDPVRNESSYNSEAAKAVVQAKRNTEKQLSTYDLAVQEMNELAANAMGIFRESETLEDNSVIYYMSNRPITKNEDGKCEFALESVVYKMTGDGFFVSNDGGLSFTSGFDSEGNAVINVLSAIGITFDWARGGTLSLGGLDNNSGVLIVFDKNGELISRLDNTGLYTTDGYFKGTVEANDGYFKGTIESKNAVITGGRINIESSSETYDVITLKYGTSSTNIRPNYLYFVDGSYRTSLSSTQIASTFGSSSSYFGYGGITVSNSSSSTNISAGAIALTNTGLRLSLLPSYSTFGGNVEISGTLDVSGATDLSGSVTIGSTSYNSLTVNANASMKGTLTVEGKATLNGNCVIGSGISDTVGFFGANGSGKNTVSTITSPSSATASSNATKINEIINALKKYNLM